MDRLTRLACRAVGAEQAAIFVRDRRDPRATVAVAAHGLDEDVIGRRFGADEGVVGEVLRGGGPVAFSDPSMLPAAVAEEMDWEMVAGGCAPIEWEGVVQ